MWCVVCVLCVVCCVLCVVCCVLCVVCCVLCVVCCVLCVVCCVWCGVAWCVVEERGYYPPKTQTSLVFFLGEVRGRGGGRFTTPLPLLTHPLLPPTSSPRNRRRRQHVVLALGGALGHLPPESAARSSTSAGWCAKFVSWPHTCITAADIS